MLHKKEQILNWLEAADQCGLSLSLAELDHILSSAPEGTKKTHEYSYLEGFRDHKFLTEQIGQRGKYEVRKKLS